MNCSISKLQRCLLTLTLQWLIRCNYISLVMLCHTSPITTKMIKAKKMTIRTSILLFTNFWTIWDWSSKDLTIPLIGRQPSGKTAMHGTSPLITTSLTSTFNCSLPSIKPSPQKWSINSLGISSILPLTPTLNLSGILPPLALHMTWMPFSI